MPDRGIHIRLICGAILVKDNKDMISEDNKPCALMPKARILARKGVEPGICRRTASITAPRLPGPGAIVRLVSAP
jgi:hypothetical protein